jgi:hypothetical protein
VAEQLAFWQALARIALRFSHISDHNIKTVLRRARKFGISLFVLKISYSYAIEICIIIKCWLIYTLILIEKNALQNIDEVYRPMYICSMKPEVEFQQLALVYHILEVSDSNCVLEVG